MKRLLSHELMILLPIGLAVMLTGKYLMSRVAAQANLDVNEIDHYITGQMATQNIPGLALAITRGNAVFYTQGYGRAQPEQPMTPQTQLFLASVSKSFTALAIVQLVEAGKVSLDLPVQSYLPEFTLADPAVASQITIRYLLNQTSGLADAGFPEGRLPQPATLAERIATLSSAQPVAPPGTEYHYFNPNYQILARVVEVVSGESFSSYLQTHIFTPLQMNQTFNAMTTNDAKQQADNLAVGHLMAFSLAIPTQEMSGFIGGSGGVISTAEDMANYLIMQNNDGRFVGESLISATSLELMHTAPDNLNSNYAMGWLDTNDHDSAQETHILEHDGVLSAYYADIVLLPKTGDGFVILYNVSSLASNAIAAPRIKNGLIALLTDRSPANGGLSLRLVGGLIGLSTLVGIALAIYSLLRLPRWRQRAKALPMWRLLLGILGTLSPALLLLAFPSIVTSSAGRAFSYLQLARSMPDIFTWLGLCAILGTINGITRVLFLLQGVHGDRHATRVG